MNVLLSQSLDLVNVRLHLPEASVQTQCIVFTGAVSGDLFFELFLSESDLESLHIEKPSLKLTAIVCDLPLAEGLSDLSELFSVSRSDFLLFVDSSKGRNGYYIISLDNENQTENPRFLLFYCSKISIMGSQADSLNFIKILKKNKLAFFNKFQLHNKKLEALEHEQRAFVENHGFLKNRISFLNTEIESGKIALKLMEEQVGKMKGQIEERKSIITVCRNCEVAECSAALAPCGHIIYCKSCVILIFLRREEIKCLKCNEEVNDYTCFKF